MRYKPDEPRLDDPPAMIAHEGRYKGAKALIVLGGYSGEKWNEIKEEIKPDIIIGANGVNGMVYGLDYWLICENMTRTNRMAKEGNASAIELMEMFHRDAGAKNKLVSHHSWDILRDKKNCTRIRRQGYETGELEGNFDLRKYGQGLLAGWLLKRKSAGAEVHVGTVGAQCLHVAGLLGCSEAHTIGYDLMFRDHEKHHWYRYPVYQVDRFRTPEMFVNYEGIPTQWTWIETAQFLKEIEPMFKKVGMLWRDHSNGLLSAMGLECANPGGNT